MRLPDHHRDHEQRQQVERQSFRRADERNEVQARNHEQRVRLRQIRDPQEMRAAQFNRAAQHRVKADEHRRLDQHRQAAAQRADLVFLPKLHLLRGEFLRVVLVFFLERLDFRRERLHPLHRARARRRQRPESRAQKNREDNNRQAVTHGRHVMQPVHRQQQRLRKKPEKSELHHEVRAVLKFRADLRQLPVFLRSGVKNNLPLDV